MKFDHRKITVAIAALALAWTAAACSSTAYLKVTYQTPEAGGGPEGKSVYLDIENRAGVDAFLSPSAKAEIKQFSGMFSVWMEGADHPLALEGAYDMTGLFDAAFRKRLNAAGVAVADDPGSGAPTLRIELKTFNIDLVGREWRARLDYEAVMQLDGRELTTQTVSGTAQRVKVIGIGDAEKLLGEIVTAMVNRLDVNILFGHPLL